MAIIKRYKNWLNEMSISDEQLKTYKNVLNNIEDYKNNCVFIQETITELRDSASEIKIELNDFENENNKIYTTPKYDADVEYLIRILKNILDKSKDTEVYSKYFSLIYPDGNETNFYPDIEIETNHLNRIHIPVGLPYILKGCRLGTKIYKTLIYKLGYLSTNILDRSMDSVFVWNSLRKDKQIYTFLRGDNIMCLSPDLNFNEIEDLVEMFYQNLSDNKIILDDDFKTRWLDEIRESPKIGKYLVI
jgi:hypothetical protein